MKLIKKIHCIFLSCLLFISAGIYAAGSPVAMLQSSSDQMLSALSQSTNRNDQALYGLVRRIILPHVDLNMMSQLVVGKYWDSASPAQRAQFETAFTRYVTHTYSNALASYKNEKVRFFPIRGGISGGKVQVNSSIDQSNGGSVSVSYRLQQVGGEWKVYDFSVEGVSIVENYRSQFADVLRTSGMAGLLQRLQQQTGG